MTGSPTNLNCVDAVALTLKSFHLESFRSAKGGLSRSGKLFPSALAGTIVVIGPRFPVSLGVLTSQV